MAESSLYFTCIRCGATETVPADASLYLLSRVRSCEVEGCGGLMSVNPKRNPNPNEHASSLGKLASKRWGPNPKGGHGGFIHRFKDLNV